jgi:hypothetical protein
VPQADLVQAIFVQVSRRTARNAVRRATPEFAPQGLWRRGVIAYFRRRTASIFRFGRALEQDAFGHIKVNCCER